MTALAPLSGSFPRIALLSGGYPPQIDGIGDYSWNLSRELARAGCPVQILTSGEQTDDTNVYPTARGLPVAPDAAVTVTRCFDPSRPATLRKLEDHLKPSLDWLVVQYNPFGFGPRGFNPWLLETLAKIRRRVGLAIMFHETYVPPWPWKFTVMRAWQWPQFWALTHLAHALFISSDRWGSQIRACNPGAGYIHLPVGSNLPRCPLRKAEARQRLGIAPETKVLGFFGSAHITKPLHLVGSAARAVQRHFNSTLLLSVGTGGTSLRAHCGAVNFRDEGCLPPEAAALRIRAMDLMLAPFADGLATRRGSAIAALQHGIPVCSTVTYWTDRLLVDSPWPGLRLSPPDRPEVYAQNAVDLLVNPPAGNAIEQQHDDVFGWSTIARRLLDALGMPDNQGQPETS